MIQNYVKAVFKKYNFCVFLDQPANTPNLARIFRKCTLHTVY